MIIIGYFGQQKYETMKKISEYDVVDLISQLELLGHGFNSDEKAKAKFSKRTVRNSPVLAQAFVSLMKGEDSSEIAEILRKLFI